MIGCVLFAPAFAFAWANLQKREEFCQHLGQCLGRIGIWDKNPTKQKLGHKARLELMGQNPMGQNRFDMKEYWQGFCPIVVILSHKNWATSTPRTETGPLTGTEGQFTLVPVLSPVFVPAQFQAQV